MEGEEFRNLNHGGDSMPEKFCCRLEDGGAMWQEAGWPLRAQSSPDSDQQGNGHQFDSCKNQNSAHNQNEPGFCPTPLQKKGRCFLNFIYFLFLAALGLCCCAWAFCNCGEWGLLLVVVRGLLTVVASRCGARALGVRVSVIMAHGLSCSATCGIFLYQGSNSCSLHWQVDS